MIDWMANLRAPGDPVEDQGMRHVCLSLAMTYVHEREITAELSAEYLHWASGIRGGRGTVAGAAAAIQADGQPPRAQWIFDSSIDDSAATYAPPPSVTGAFQAATSSVAVGIDDTIQSLVDGHLVVLALRTSPQWYFEDVRIITGGLPRFRGHAVVAVGAGVLRDPLPAGLTAGERVICIRNSWGDDWGARGYALLTERAFAESVDWVLQVNP